MDSKKAVSIGIQALEESGLASLGWRGKFDHPKFRYQRHGATTYSKKLILFNVFDIWANDERFFREVLGHEMGHASSHISAGHGEHWREQAYKHGMTEYCDQMYTAYARQKSILRISIEEALEDIDVDGLVEKNQKALLPSGYSAELVGTSKNIVDDQNDTLVYVKDSAGRYYRTDLDTAYSLGIDWKVSFNHPSYPKFVGKKVILPKSWNKELV
jgi:hypothetical protein